MKAERGGARGPAPLLVFLASLSLYTLTAGGSLTSTDAIVTFDLTRRLVEHRSVALSGNLLGLDANRGVDGRYYSQYGIGQSLYNIPFFLAGTWAQRAVGRPIGKPDTVPKAAVALGSAVAAAAAVALVWLLAVRISGDPRASLIAAAAAAVASPLWPYSKFGFSTPLTAVILLGAAYLLLVAAETGRWKPAAGAGLVMAFGWLTRHEMAVALVPFVLFSVVHGRRRGASAQCVARQVLALILCALIGGAVWAGYNTVRFGAPTAVGYTPSFAAVGYLAYAVAPAGSVLLFCPIALLWISGLASREVPTATRVLLAGPLLAFYGFYGALADWPGGRSYGPRYLVPALILMSPAVAPMLARRPERRGVALAVIAACAVLQLPGVLVDYSKVSLDWARRATKQEILAREWRVRSSPLVLNARAALVALPLNASYLSGRSPLPARPEPAGAADQDFAQQFSFSLDFWWVYLVYLRVMSPAAAVAAAAALATMTLVFSWMAARAGPQP